MEGLDVRNWKEGKCQNWDETDLWKQTKMTTKAIMTNNKYIFLFNIYIYFISYQDRRLWEIFIIYKNM